MTSVPGTNGCPDRATLDRYFAGTMPAEEIRRIVDHLAGCPICHERRLSAEAQERLLTEIRSLADAGELLLAGPRTTGASAPTGWPRIEGFRLIRPIGNGGMGHVYEAEQELPTRRVAIKILKRMVGPGSSPLRAQTFSREVQALGRLNHPGIATVHAAGTTESAEPYLAMELVHGPRIDDYADAHALTPAQGALLVARVCDAVQHAHDQGVLHCDIKPSNILVPDSGQPKLLDFGLARVVAADAPVATTAGGSGGLGTLAYMSPEAIRGDPTHIDARTDVYALGAVLYRLITRRHALAGDHLTPAEIAARICEGRIPPPSTLNPDVAPEIDRVVMRAMDPAPANRPTTAAALAAAFRASAEAPAVVTRSRSQDRRRLPLLILAGLAAGASIVGGGVLLNGSWREADPPVPPSSTPFPAAPGPSLVHDARRSGPPKEGQQVHWIWTHYYITGDIQEAWSREQEALSKPTDEPLSAEELFRAGLVAFAAKAYPEAIRYFERVSRKPNPFADDSRAFILLSLSNWRGCEAAKKAATSLYAQAKRRGGNDVRSSHSWLVLAEHYSRCGDAARATECLNAAQATLNARPVDDSQVYFDRRLRALTIRP